MINESLKQELILSFEKCIEDLYEKTNKTLYFKKNKKAFKYFSNSYKDMNKLMETLDRIGDLDTIEEFNKYYSLYNFVYSMNRKNCRLKRNIIWECDCINKNVFNSLYDTLNKYDELEEVIESVK